MENQTPQTSSEKLAALTRAAKISIIEMRIALMLPALESNLLEDTSFIWAKTLIGKVPADRVGDAMTVALHLHKSGFPVTPGEVISGWEEIYQEERTTKPQTGSAVCPFCIRIRKNPGINEVCQYHPKEQQ
jgi:hypothetical protein